MRLVCSSLRRAYSDYTVLPHQQIAVDHQWQQHLDRASLLLTAALVRLGLMPVDPELLSVRCQHCTSFASTPMWHLQAPPTAAGADAVVSELLSSLAARFVDVVRWRGRFIPEFGIEQSRTCRA